MIGAIDMADADWNHAATIQELDEAGGLLGRSVRGVAVALYHADGMYFATSDRCTHGRTSLSTGYLDGFLIECPLHQGLFDIRTGEVKGPPCFKPLPVFPIRRDGDNLLVDLGSVPKKE